MPVEKTDIECPFCGKKLSNEVPAHHLKPGTVLNKKYIVGAALGEGGFGITYIGRDLTLDIRVAIKEYFPNGYVNRSNTVSPEISCGMSYEKKEFFSKGRERFLKEARILAKFSGDPGIVDVRDFFEENNTAYIVMEYLDGQDLKEYLKQHGTLTAEKTVTLLMPVMKSLIKIHRQGLIHRDISPDNIRLMKDSAKLIDFGAARNISAYANKSLSVMLKPGYAPEEQYRSKGKQGPWTDVYALCATMYKCITGVTPDDAAQRVFNDEVKTPSALGVRIDKTIENAIMKGLSVLQKDRYQSVEGLISGLNGINISSKSDEKTIYSGKSVSEDDKETKFISIEDDILTQQNQGTNESTESKPESVVVSDADKKEKAEIKPKPEPLTKNEEDNKSREISKNKPTDVSNEKKKKTKRLKKSGIKKRIGIVALSAVLVIVAIVGITTVFNTLNNITICGEKIDKNQTRITLSDKTITVDDMKSLISLGKLESLAFRSCTFDKAAVEYIGDFVSLLKEISFYGCKDIDDYSCLSDLTYLTSLTISECGLTNEQLNEIELSNKDYLMDVNLTNNSELTDIQKISDISDTLTNIDVSKTAVKDFSALKDCKVLVSVTANGNGIEDISSLTNETILYLYIDENNIADISPIENFKYLKIFYASKNKITDISALENHRVLYDLNLNENMIEDLSPLNNCESLITIKMNGNRINSLKGLSDCKNLAYVYFNRNKLTNLDGLEHALELKTIEVSENLVEDINGLKNSTILEAVNMNDNNISDISVLSKSVKTLKRLYFNNNQVTDITALKNTASIEYLSFDNNYVTTLDSLSSSVSLLAVSGEYNQITSIDGLSNSTKLKYIYLPHNKIENMSAISNLEPRAENDFAVIDLSSNNISALNLNGDKKFTYLAIYNNPIKSLSSVKNYDGTYLLFTYIDGMDLSGFNDAFSYYRVVDCPLDKQVSVKQEIGKTYNMSVSFSTCEEADKEIRDAKDVILTGSTKSEDQNNE